MLAPAEAQTTPALHVSGNTILDSRNHVVILRGLGRAGDLESASGMWSGPGDPVIAFSQKWRSTRSNIVDMDATFKCYKQVWHVNMIRLFILPSWYWQNNIVPAKQDPQNYGSYTTAISYRTYITTVVREAAKYGIYVDICPYQLVSNYQDGNVGNTQGLPMSGWDQAGRNFIRSTGLREQTFWSRFWALMANNLKSYPNVIFEAWNEPANLGNDPITANYLSYLKNMYNAVRNTGARNLIFMQWDASYVPSFNDLSWCSQIRNTIPNARNLVFTTHAYRHAPYFNTPWGTNTTMVQSQLSTAIASMGVNAPLVINEAGSCMAVVAPGDIANELGWWDGLNHAAANLEIGVTAYFWMSDSDFGPIYAGEALLNGTWPAGVASPAPNNLGKIFLNYAIGTPLTATPTATPNPTP